MKHKKSEEFPDTFQKELEDLQKNPPPQDFKTKEALKELRKIKERIK